EPFAPAWPLAPAEPFAAEPELLVVELKPFAAVPEAMFDAPPALPEPEASADELPLAALLIEPNWLPAPLVAEEAASFTLPAACEPSERAVDVPAAASCRVLPMPDWTAFPATVRALPAALRVRSSASAVPCLAVETAERARPAAAFAASPTAAPSRLPVAEVPSPALPPSAAWPALTAPLAAAWPLDWPAAWVAACVAVVAVDAARWRRRSARRWAARGLMSGMPMSPLPILPMPRAEPPIWPFTGPIAWPIVAWSWPAIPPTRPPPRCWAYALVTEAKASAPVHRAMPRVLLLRVLLRMSVPPAGGESAASGIHYARSRNILPCRPVAVARCSASGRQHAMTAAGIAAREAGRMGFADQALQHLRRRAGTGSIQQPVGVARHDRCCERGATQAVATAADHARRAEGHLLAAGRLGQYAAARIDGTDADHARVGRREQRWRRGAVVARGSDQHVATREHHLHRAREHRVVGSDQADVDHRHAFAIHPGERIHQLGGGAANLVGAPQVGGIQGFRIAGDEARGDGGAVPRCRRRAATVVLDARVRQRGVGRIDAAVDHAHAAHGLGGCRRRRTGSGHRTGIARRQVEMLVGERGVRCGLLQDAHGLARAASAAVVQDHEIQSKRRVRRRLAIRGEALRLHGGELRIRQAHDEKLAAQDRRAAGVDGDAPGLPAQQRIHLHLEAEGQRSPQQLVDSLLVHAGQSAGQGRGRQRQARQAALHRTQHLRLRGRVANQCQQHGQQWNGQHGVTEQAHRRAPRERRGRMLALLRFTPPNRAVAHEGRNRPRQT